MAFTAMTLVWDKQHDAILNVSMLFERARKACGDEEFARRLAKAALAQTEARLLAFYPRESDDFARLHRHLEAVGIEGFREKVEAADPQRWIAPTAPGSRPATLWNDPHDTAWIDSAEGIQPANRVRPIPEGNEMATVSREGLAYGWIRAIPFEDDEAISRLSLMADTNGQDWLAETLEGIAGCPLAIYRCDHPEASFHLGAVARGGYHCEDCDIWAISPDGTIRTPLDLADLVPGCEHGPVSGWDIAAHLRKGNEWKADPALAGIDENGGYEIALVLPGAEFDADCRQARVSDHDQRTMNFLDSMMPALALKKKGK